MNFMGWTDYTPSTIIRYQPHAWDNFNLNSYLTKTQSLLKSYAQRERFDQRFKEVTIASQIPIKTQPSTTQMQHNQHQYYMLSNRNKVSKRSKNLSLPFLQHQKSNSNMQISASNEQILRNTKQKPRDSIPKKPIQMQRYSKLTPQRRSQEDLTLTVVSRSPQSPEQNISSPLNQNDLITSQQVLQQPLEKMKASTTDNAMRLSQKGFPKQREKSPFQRKDFNARLTFKAVMPKLDLQKQSSQTFVQLYQNFVLFEKLNHETRPKRHKERSKTVWKRNRSVMIRQSDYLFEEKCTMFQRKIIAHILSKRSLRKQPKKTGKSHFSQYDKDLQPWPAASNENQEDGQNKMLKQTSTITRGSLPQSTPVHQDSLKPLKAFMDAFDDKQEDEIVKQEEEIKTVCLEPLIPLNRIIVYFTDENLNQREEAFSYPNYEMDQVLKKMTEHSHSKSPVARIKEQEKNQMKSSLQKRGSNIYGLVTKAMMQKKNHLRSVKSMDISDISRVIDDNEQDQFIDPQSVQQYTKYYIQNHLIKILEKSGDVDFTPLEGNTNKPIQDVTEFKGFPNQKESSLQTLRSDTILTFNDMKNPKPRPSHIRQTELNVNKIRSESQDGIFRILEDMDFSHPFQDQGENSLDSLNKTPPQEREYQLDYIKIKTQIPIDRLKRMLLIPTLVELEEDTRNELLQQCDPHDKDPIEAPAIDKTAEITEQVNRLYDTLSRREIHKQTKFLWKKRDQILNGTWEDDLQILINQETKYLIQSCVQVDQPTSLNLHIPMNNDTQSKKTLTPQQKFIKSSFKNPQKPSEPPKQLFIKLTEPIMDSPPGDESMQQQNQGQQRLRTNDTNYNSEHPTQDAHVEIPKPQKIHKVISHTPKNLPVSTPIGRKPQKSLTRLTQLAQEKSIDDHFLNVTRIRQGSPVVASQKSIITTSESGYSQVKRMEREPNMDKYALIFRNMVLQKRKAQSQNILERINNAICEEKLYDLEEIANTSHFINFNDQDENGCTLLMKAAQVGSIEIIRFLLTHGAHTGIINNKGESAVSIALQYQHFQAADALIDHQRHETSGRNF